MRLTIKSYSGEQPTLVYNVDYSIIPMLEDHLSLELLNEKTKLYETSQCKVVRRHIVYNKVGGVELVTIFVKTNY